ncbi:SsrA-binding protein SmpB [Patescibacteria group bacterium]|nr:MAG: SsrA-binding protein SmpB [Patescibacteria group bacterium]
MKPIIENKKARLEYEILESFEAGLELSGGEVKALRAGRGSLIGSRVVVRGGEAFVVGMTIPPYQAKNTPSSYDPERTRRILLSKKQIAELASSEGQKGLTIIPIMVYNKVQLLKLQVAIVRHKKKHDKRDTLRSRDAKRDIERTLKNQD